MARRSSSGLPFLVRRHESGVWNYHRAFAIEILPFFDGEMVLSWSGKVVGLDHGKALKVSLGTTDQATARDRWAEVHAHVQRSVDLAAQRLAEARSASRRSIDRRPALTPGERQLIAEQVRHDILARHDLETVEPATLSPLAEIIAGLARPSNRSPTDVAEDARRLARQIERSDAKRALLRRGRAIADTELVLREAANGTEKQEHAAILEVVHPDIDRHLAENGIILDSQRERELAQLGLQRARLAAHQAVAARDKGRNIPTPDRPAPIGASNGEVTQEDPVPTLSRMLEIWRQHRNPQEKDWSDRALYNRRFIQHFGDLRVDEIKKKHIREFRDLHKEVPKSVPRRLQGATLSELVAYGQQHPETPSLAWHTINTKAIGSLQAVLKLAVSEGYCEVNVASGMHLDSDRDPKKSQRLPFSSEQVRRLFAAPEFTSGQPLSTGGCGEAGYWLPILSVYTGARVEELAQLDLTDIKRSSGIDYFDITTLDNAPDREAEPIEYQKSLKNPNARREVPLHPDLITLGFLDYVDDMRRAGHRRVFPVLKAYRGRYSKNIGRWLNRLLDQHVSDRPEYAYHSLRHVFADVLRNEAPIQGILDKVINGLVGHAGGDTSDKYGLPHVLKSRQHALNFFRIEDLDLSQFKRPGLCG